MALLDDVVADFALAVEDADVIDLLIESADEEAEEAVVILAVADALALGVTDSTVFLLSTTKGAL